MFFFFFKWVIPSSFVSLLVYYNNNELVYTIYIVDYEWQTERVFLSLSLLYIYIDRALLGPPGFSSSSCFIRDETRRESQQEHKEKPAGSFKVLLLSDIFKWIWLWNETTDEFKRFYIRERSIVILENVCSACVCLVYIVMRVYITVSHACVSAGDDEYIHGTLCVWYYKRMRGTRESMMR